MWWLVWGVLVTWIVKLSIAGELWGTFACLSRFRFRLCFCACVSVTVVSLRGGIRLVFDEHGRQGFMPVTSGWQFSLATVIELSFSF